MSSEKYYYVYIYRHPITRLPFYVGKGLDKRMFVHLNETFENTENRKKYAVIKGLLNKGLKPLIGRYAKNLDESAAYDIEERLIAKWGRRDIDPGGILTNICANNRPPNSTGRIQSDTTKQNISIKNSGKNNGMFGRKGELSPRYGIGLSGSSNGFYGKTHSKEFKEANAERSRNRAGTWNQSDNQKQIASEVNRNVWLITKPNGEEIKVDNLKQFCKDNNMSKHAAELLQRVYRQYTKTGRIIKWKEWNCQLLSAKNHTTLKNLTKD